MNTIKAISFVFLIILVLLNFVSGDKEKSLFDDLPLNGAYSPTAVNIASVKVPLKSHVLVSPRKVARANDNSDPTVSVERKLASYEQSQQSLFDEMPNKGAMIPTTGDLNVSESRTQRSFVAPELLIRSDAAVNGIQLEVEEQTPSAEFNLVDFNQNFLPPIVQSLTREDVPHTVLSPIVQQQIPETLVLNTPLPRSGHESYPARRYSSNSVQAIPVRTTNREVQQRNPSVIIYGSSAPGLATQRETITNKEVYHHYHFTAPPRSQLIKDARNFKTLRVSEPIPNYGNQQRTPITGGYGQAPPTSTTTTTVPIPDNQPTFPVIIGGSLSDTVGGDYDYETLQDRPHRQFSSRTGSGSFKAGLVIDTGTGHRNSYNIPQQHFSQPSDSYGPPSPSPTYGPPSPEPAPSYGSYPEAPVPVVEPPAPPPPTSTTSISYQTIPIQTVQTQLVTVPHVTVSASSTAESDFPSDGLNNNRPQRPSRPSSVGTAYGPPGSRSTFSTPSRGGLASESLFTDDQIAALLSVARGSGNQYTDDDSISSLLTGVRGSGNIIGAGNILGGANILGGGNILGGSNILGNDIGFQLGGARQIIPQSPSLNRFRNNGISNDQLLAALLGQQRYSEGFVSNQNRVTFPSRGLRGGILTGDAVDAVSDLIREQRLRGAISDLSGRLRYQNRNAQRANERYRSLFYKGALLLSALTLIPAVASPLAAAANSAAASNAFLLPLATGRRKREILLSHTLSPFENCKSLSDSNDSHRFNKWFNCALNATESLFDENLNETTDESGSILNKMAFKGAFVPENIRMDLKETLSPEEIRKNSECLQKRFCETILEIETLPNAETFLFLYSIFASDVENNPWIRESMTAGRNNNCGAFFCFEDYNNRQEIQ